jgi:hypothetical protein
VTLYHAGDVVLDSEQTDLQFRLAHLHEAKKRLHCSCCTPGPEMYIARFGTEFLIKRMPNSGEEHHPCCTSYEPPIELSGLGAVAGTAIIEDPESGQTTLRLDFSLSKAPGRKPPPPSENTPVSVVATPHKLTLRALLHHLWEQAEFHRWTANMSGKRHWSVIRGHLLRAADQMVTQKKTLSDQLYIPEAWSKEPAEQAAATRRRLAKLTQITNARHGTQKLMLVIGEVKKIAPGHYGQVLTFKHLPDFHFRLSPELLQKLVRAFPGELEARDVVPDSRLIAIGTFSVSRNGYASIEEMSVMTVSAQWIPFENISEAALIDALMADRREFHKCLRYNLQPKHPLASIVLRDTTPKPVAMYVIPTPHPKDYIAAMTDLLDQSKLPQWFCYTGTTEMPPVPHKSGYESMAFTPEMDGI